MKPTLQALTAAILDASARLSASENTRYPFNCADAAIVCNSQGSVYCGTNANPTPDEIVLMDESAMCDVISEDMTQEDAESLASQILENFEENEIPAPLLVGTKVFVPAESAHGVIEKIHPDGDFFIRFDDGDEGSYTEHELSVI